MKYSIILPCYNVAKYLNRCLDSIYSMENEKEQFFSLENSADSDETSSGENNIAYTRKLSLDAE